MKVYPPRDIRPFVMYCVNGKPRSSLLIESTDSMMTIWESGWNLSVWLVGVVSRRWVWLVGGIYGYGYNVYVWLVGVVVRRCRLVGVVSRRWVWLVGGIYGYGYNV